MNATANGQIKKWICPYKQKKIFFQLFFQNYYFNLLILDLNNAQTAPNFTGIMHRYLELTRLVKKVTYKKCILSKCPLLGSYFKFTQKPLYLFDGPSSEHSLLHPVLLLFGNIVPHSE